MLPSEVPRLTTDPPVSVSWCLETSFLRLPSRNGSPSLPLLSLFLSFIFFPTSLKQWAAFLGAWCPLEHSEVVLWNLLNVQMFFWSLCGGESGLPVLFLCHLRTAPMNLLEDEVFWQKASEYNDNLVNDKRLKKSRLKTDYNVTDKKLGYCCDIQ